LAPHVCQQREAVVTEHIDAENRHDPDATVATFSGSKVSYDIPAYLHIEHGPLRHGEDHIPLEARVTDTQRADWLGISSRRAVHGRAHARSL
jgi:hypothetical protein